MNTSDTGLKFIAEHEGMRLKAYPDPGTGGEPWTIGVGHTGGVSPCDTCTEAQALEWLREDVAEAEAAINELVTTDITQPQYDALVSFIFNCGRGNFAKSTLLKKVNADDVDGAAAEFSKWDMAAGRHLAGLTKRRLAEAALFQDEYLA